MSNSLFLFKFAAGIMDNPFCILSIFWHLRRPSLINKMPVIRNSFWLRKGYAALTFFGTVIASTQEDAEEFEDKKSTLRNHEMIHLRQAQSTHDSWLLFYLLYGWYSLLALPYCRKMKNAVYWLNPFEIEAYLHEDDLHYLDSHDATEWRQYAHMKPSERIEKVRLIFKK